MEERPDSNVPAGSEVLAEHRVLDGLIAEVVAALRSRDGPAARHALECLHEALETHFEREDRLYYPQILALSPQRRAPLRALGVAHRSLLSRLAEIQATVADVSTGEALRAFEALARSFENHESLEESLLRSIDEELQGAQLSHHAPVQ